MWSSWAMARRAAFADISLDGGRADSGRVCEGDSMGALRAGTGAVRAAYAAPLPTLASESPHRGHAAVWPTDSASVARVGNPHLVAGLGYVGVVESVLPDSPFRGVSRPGGASRVGGGGAGGEE